MRLDASVLKNRLEWEKKGYALPSYDREKMIVKTKENPCWVHFGAGNIFRAFHAALAQNMLNENVSDRGIIVVEGYDYDIIREIYRPNDNYSILVTLKADGTVEKTVLGSIAESYILDTEEKAEFDRLKEIFSSDSLQMVTFTITEKGYAVKDPAGNVLPLVAEDLSAGPEHPVSYIGKVASLLYTRYQAGEKPIAMVSTDNCSHNGDKLHAAMEAFAGTWAKNKKADAGFLSYVNDSKKVSFPWSMIDKITPRPDVSVETMLKGDGLEEVDPVITEKHSYVAPFVNAEETEYLVIEDAFPNGRPQLEKAGVVFTDKEHVDKVERMKVCTCLNPLHTAMSIYGCLLGFTKISDEMKDEDIVKLIRGIGYEEGLPVVTDPEVLKPREFIDTVVGVRLPNPFMPDTPQRICTDTSQKLAIRFGETIRNYQKSGRALSELKRIPLVFAGWLRYLMAIDDQGKDLELSPDPLLAVVRPFVADVRMGDQVKSEQLRELLENETIFGVNLFEAGMADRVIGYFNELIAGIGAVRATLQKYV